ncbi:MAG: ATP-binding protein [Cyclobacteriaceae bacterium]
MQKEQVNLLLVDDDEDDYILVRDLLHEIQTTDFSITWVDRFEEALAALQKDNYDVYLIDYRLGENNGLELLKKGITLGVSSPIIMLTGKGFPEIDYQAMQMGAADYLVKDGINAMVMERSIRYAINNSQTMSKLYEEEQKYRTLFEQSVNAIYTTNREDLLVNANWAMVKLVGYELQELRQLSLRDLFAQPEEYSQLYQQLTQHGFVKDFEALLRHKNKRPIAGSISATRLIDTDQNLIGYQGVIADVSEKKKVQQELIRLEKMMMTANIARSIAHEVRNPLTNITLSLEQFASEISDRDDLEVYLDIIRRNTKRINELITAMLNSSKPSQLSLKIGSLNEVLDKTLALAADRIKLREVRIDLQYNSSLTKLPLDQDKLAMAFLNIINNAIEAVEKGSGKITLKTSEDEEHEYLAIMDNGHGIEPSEIDKLFDAFHTGKRGGMGLGLTSTQNIINSHKASISVESKVKEGTCFKIIFPKKAVASLLRK